MYRSIRSRRERGGSFVEFIIVIPVFAFVLAGIFEMALMYRTRALLNAATFEAAQQGSLNNALMRNIRDGLAQGMMPLYLRTRGPTGVAAAYAQARLRIASPVPFGGVTIVSPTRDVFNKFAESQTIQTTRDNSPRRQNVIPNDNLMWRSTVTRSVRVEGQTVPMNVQDANVLKVRSFWCYRLLTPLLDRIIWETAASPTRILGGGPNLSTEERSCALLSTAGNGYYIALTSSAVTRMQSPAVSDNLP